TTEETPKEAEEETASAFPLPSYPTATEQKHSIEAQVAALYAGEISVPAEVIDEILRTGGNRSRSQLRLIYNCMIEDQTEQERTEFVRREYGTGGKGLTIDGLEFAVWFDELGMQIAQGNSVLDQVPDKVF